MDYWDFFDADNPYERMIRHRLDAAERNISHGRERARRSVDEKVARLEMSLAILSIANRAMFELLTEKGLVTAADIEDKMDQLARRQAEGDVQATPEALATDLQIPVEDQALKDKTRIAKERLARERLRNFRRHDE